MASKRKSVSMTFALYRRLAWASTITGKSMCRLVADAVAEKLEREGIGRPHRDWHPPDPMPRKRKSKLRVSDEMAGGVHMFHGSDRPDPR